MRRLNTDEKANFRHFMTTCCPHKPYYLNTIYDVCIVHVSILKEKNNNTSIEINQNDNKNNNNKNNNNAKLGKK